MTHDEMIAVIQHHKNGGVVEVREKHDTIWKETEKPWFDFNTFDYRAKPEPLVLWGVYYVSSGGLCCSFTSESEARSFVTKSIISVTLKKFVEVTE